METRWDQDSGMSWTYHVGFNICVAPSPVKLVS